MSTPHNGLYDLQSLSKAFFSSDLGRRRLGQSGDRQRVGNNLLYLRLVSLMTIVSSDFPSSFNG